MNRSRMRLLGAAIALGALLFAGVTAAVAANGSAGTFFGRMMGGSGQTGMMNGAGPGGMMGGTGSQTLMNGSWHGGMMGGWAQAGTPGTSISIEQARQDVQRYIDRLGNTKLAIDEVIEFQHNFYAVVKDKSTGHGAFEVLVNNTTEAPDQFPGYYTIHFLENGTIAGMLSVNGYSGQIWYHSWHGKAIRVLEVGG